MSGLELDLPGSTVGVQQDLEEEARRPGAHHHITCSFKFERSKAIIETIKDEPSSMSTSPMHATHTQTAQGRHTQCGHTSNAEQVVPDVPYPTYHFDTHTSSSSLPAPQSTSSPKINRQRNTWTSPSQRCTDTARESWKRPKVTPIYRTLSLRQGTY